MSRRKRSARRFRKHDRGEVPTMAVDQAWGDPALFEEWLQDLASVASERRTRPREDLDVDHFFVEDGYDELMDEVARR